MPGYELTMILRAMSKPDLSAALKRTGEFMLKNGAILRKIENLGTKELPMRMTRHGHQNTEGSYFLFRFDSSLDFRIQLQDELNRDVDVIRRTVLNVSTDGQFPCTLEEEMQPPAYRPSVRKLMEDAKDDKRNKKKHVFVKPEGPV